MRSKDHKKRKLFLGLVAILAFAFSSAAQTTAFNYQGSLKDGGTPASGSFQMQFKLFDSLGGAGQIGSTITDVPVTATQGVFSVKLDFGSNALSGSNRWIEIAVRHNSSESYTTLAPREQIASSPYSVRTLSAATADVALNANQLGGMAASEYISNSTISSTAIRNQATLQTPANFNISGNGFIGGNVGIGTAIPATKLDVRGMLTLETGGSPGLFTSANAGEQNRYLTLLNSFTTQTASGLKAGGILVSDDYLYANPGKNDLIVKGNVGIGTNTPQSKLNVSAPGYGFTHTSGTVSIGSYIDLNTSAGWFGTRSNHPLAFFTNNAAFPQMTVATDGHVGIGTPTPSARLTVSGSGLFNAANAARFDLVNPVAGGGFLQNVTDAGLWQIATTAGSTRMVINPSGNVGIGTAAPNAQLQIAGTGTNGFTLGVEGNATQNLASGGFAKAMIVVNPNGTLARCYNGITGATGNCGFGIIRNSTGDYVVNFGFQVSDRFAAVTSQADASMVYGPNSTLIQVFTYAPAGNLFDAVFTIIVY